MDHTFSMSHGCSVSFGSGNFDILSICHIPLTVSEQFCFVVVVVAACIVLFGDLCHRGMLGPWGRVGYACHSLMFGADGVC